VKVHKEQGTLVVVTVGLIDFLVIETKEHSKKFFETDKEGIITEKKNANLKT